MFSKRSQPEPKPSASVPVPQAEVESPCNGICEMDWANNICKGCFRTPNEIGAWSGLDAQAKLAIKAAALERNPG